MERTNDFGHEVKFYGCDYCIDFLKGYYNESVSVENIEFDIADDLKMYIHSKEESGIVTIDGDLILIKAKMWYLKNRRMRSLAPETIGKI